MLATKQGVYLPELILVPKRQLGVQMDLISSELSDGIQTIVKEDTVKKIVLKIENTPGNFYCSFFLIIFFHRFQLQ